HGLEGVVGELELDPVELEELAVLLDERVLRLDEDAHERLLVEAGDGADHRQPSDELGDEAELEQVLGQDLGQRLTQVAVAGATNDGAEADALVTDPAVDELLDARERAAADEQDVRRVDLDELLVRMLAPALRRHRRRRALEDLEQRLLDALA